MIFNTKCSKKLKPSVHVQVVEIHANLVPGGFFFFPFFLCRNAVRATPIGTSGLHPGEEEELNTHKKKPCEVKGG